MVTVLRSGRTKDPCLGGAFARNVWFTAALAGVELQYTHVLGKIIELQICSLGGRTQLEMSMNSVVWSRTQYG